MLHSLDVVNCLLLLGDLLQLGHSVLQLLHLSLVHLVEGDDQLETGGHQTELGEHLVLTHQLNGLDDDAQKSEQQVDEDAALDQRLLVLGHHREDAQHIDGVDHQGDDVAD